MTGTITWYPAESADDTHDDQETHLGDRMPGGASWAVVTEDGKDPLRWLWFIYAHWLWEDIDADPAALLANGEAATQDEAKAAIETWVAAAQAATTPCEHCGGDYWQEYAGPPPVAQFIPHADECTTL